MPAHVKTCKGKAEAAKPRRRSKPARPPRQEASPRPARRPRPRPAVGAGGPSLMNGSAVVERLLSVKEELEQKAAALGRMAEELSSI